MVSFVEQQCGERRGYDKVEGKLQHSRIGFFIRDPSTLWPIVDRKATWKNVITTKPKTLASDIELHQRPTTKSHCHERIVYRKPSAISAAFGSEDHDR